MGMVSLCFIIRLLHASHKVEGSTSKLYSMVAHQPLIVTISDQKMTWKAEYDLAMPCDFSRFHLFDFKDFRKMVPAACHLKNDRGIGSGQVRSSRTCFVCLASMGFLYSNPQMDRAGGNLEMTEETSNIPIQLTETWEMKEDKYMEKS